MYGSHPHSTVIQLLFVAAVVGFFFTAIVVLRIAFVIKRGKHDTPRPRSCKGHLLVVLGSGGHTAEMLNILRRVPRLRQSYPRRTYVVSSGDGFSALKASEFEKEISNDAAYDGDFEVVTVRRARRVHQGVLTAPYTTILCLWDCVQVLRGKHPDQNFKSHSYADVILTNGPGTGVCIVVASIILLFLGLGGPETQAGREYNEAGEMRSVFIESWARVKTLSLSGRILRPLVDRFLVQWPQLADRSGNAEYVGALIA